MKNTDRFLIGIVSGILLLVIAAFAVTLLQPAPAYQPDETPENIAHNYLLAIGQEDFERAYSYLSPDLEGYPPDLETFIQDIQRNRWKFGYQRNHTLTIESARNIGSLFSIVTVRETIFYNNGLFSSRSSSNQFTFQLKKVRDVWKLVSGDNYFWSCWSKLDSYCR